DERTLLDAPGHQLRPFPRLRMISLFDFLFFCRVRPSGFPQGVAGWRPPDDFPSPPPSGWSIGFIATPRTDGRLLSQRARPALPSWRSSCSALPTTPTVPLQVASTSRISPDGRRTVALPASLAISWTLVPADLAIRAPPPGFSSTAWITVPTGIFLNGRAFPVRTSA